MPSALFDIDVVVAFWLLLFYFFPSSREKLSCFKVHKIWNYHKFCLIMINCYSWLNKPDSSLVVSWLHSVLFPLNYISIIIIIIQITINIIIIIILLLLLLLSSLLLSPLLFLFFCVLADLIPLYLLREQVMTHENGPLDFDSLL